MYSEMTEHPGIPSEPAVTQPVGPVDAYLLQHQLGSSCKNASRHTEADWDQRSVCSDPIRASGFEDMVASYLSTQMTSTLPALISRHR